MKNQGYIAITSAIIVGLVLLVITLAYSIASFYSSANVSDAGQKENSQALSEGCADSAILKLAQNIYYPGNETVKIASSSCTILPVATSTVTSSQRIIETQATSTRAVSNIKVIFDTSNFSIISWQQLSNF